ncbi:MAG: hypothetical protein JSW07_17945 [bacterium]|nr:MAG: hypothetical protein JSW07_17945 [bacterium]
MKILTIRKGFQADHSSTSYEFFAIDKPLNKSERANVARLSSRARPTKRRVSFIYHGDWSDLPGGWGPLMRKYYDVMYSESYDWWTLAMAFNTDKKTIDQIKQFEFGGTDGMGVTVESDENRVIVSIFCHLYPGFDFGDDYDYYEDEYDEDDFEVEDTIESEDYLLNLLAENRNYLDNGDYRLLYGVWQKYGFEPEDNDELDESIPPEPPDMDNLPKPIETLLSFLEVH